MSGRRSDSTSSTPLERVDQAGLPDVGESDDSDGEGLTGWEMSSVGFKKLDERSGSEGEGGDGSGGRSGRVGGRSGGKVKGRDVVSLRLGGGFERESREVVSEVSKPSLDCWSRNEIW